MKILFIGLGSIGQRHLRNLRCIDPDIEILAYRSIGRNLKISDDMMAEYTDLRKHYNIKTFTDYAAALEQRPDAVLVTCPTSLHIPIALEAAKYNCHLFIEKPLSDSMEGVNELIKIVEQKNLVALVGYQLRFHPALRLIHELLHEGKIGKILSAHIEFGKYLPGAHPYEDYRQGYCARKSLGGGALLSLSHELDYAQWLFGMPKRVFALGGKLSSLEVDVDDSDDILMDCSIPVHIHLDFLQQPSSRKCTIIGEGGRVFWDYYTRPFLYTVERGYWETFPVNLNRNDIFLAEIRHFIDCVEGREKPIVDINEGLKALRIALAAKRSIRSGKRVVVPNEG